MKFSQHKLVSEFWARILELARDRNITLRIPNVTPSKIINFGQKVHLLEWLSCLEKRNQFADKVPGEMLEASRRQRTKTATRESVYQDVLQEIEGNFSALPGIWLKGSVALRENHYPTGLRRMADLDLLIRREDLPDWHQILQQLGLEPFRSFEWVMSDDFPSEISALPYRGEIQGIPIMIDLHWHLVVLPFRRRVQRWNYDMGPIWDHASDHSMAPEHRLLYMADHGAKHGFGQWKMFLDVLVLLKNYSLDHEFLGQEANRMNYEVSLGLLRRVMEELGGRNLCPKPLSNYSLLELTDRQQSFVNQARQAKTPTGAYLMICLETLSSWRSKLLFLWYLLFPPVSCMSAYPEPIRGWELVRIYFRRGIRVIKGGYDWLRGKDHNSRSGIR